ARRTDRDEALQCPGRPLGDPDVARVVAVREPFAPALLQAAGRGEDLPDVDVLPVGEGPAPAVDLGQRGRVLRACAADHASNSRCSRPTTGERSSEPTLRTASSTPGMNEERSVESWRIVRVWPTSPRMT